MKRPSIFLDRDGVINRNSDDYVKNWEEFQFLPGSLKAIKSLTGAGYQIIVITNQACINKGLVSAQTLNAIHRQMILEIEKAGGQIHAIYHCPHREEEGCDCRKPKPGMLIQAAYEHAIELPDSYLIGDSIRDIKAGQQVGCKSLLVLTGHGQKTYRQLKRPGFHANAQMPEVFSDLSAAVLWILSQG